MEIKEEEYIILEGGGISGGCCSRDICGKPFGLSEKENDIPLGGRNGVKELLFEIWVAHTAKGIESFCDLFEITV